MKTRNLLLALGCAAAFTACTNNDEPAVAPVLRTVTLSVEVVEPADTRVAYSTDDEKTYKFKWSDTDKLRVFYNEDGEEKYADFVNKSYIGNKAFFENQDGTFPSDYTGTVTIGYRSENTFAGENGNLVNVNGEPITSDYPLTKALAAFTALYAENVAVTGGQLPDNVKLNHAYAYLLLKEGLLVTNSDMTVTSSDGEMELRIGGDQRLSFSSTGMETKPYSLAAQTGRVYVTNGKLTRDYFVPINVGKEGGDAIELNTFAIQSIDGTYPNSTAVTQPAHAYVPGKIYEVAADNTNWKATLFE
ncbi:MAG: hypothetical protein IJ845_06870 [Bacteroidaceae bacterium]|nr:hypothetical protein [Bacteroidaceae bacterium]